MLTNVFFSGRLGDFADDDKSVRFVEVDRVIPDECGRYEVDLLPVFSAMTGGLFFTAKKGSLIIARGRLETRKNFGAVIVLELDEIFPTKKN